MIKLCSISEMYTVCEHTDLSIVLPFLSFFHYKQQLKKFVLLLQLGKNIIGKQSSTVACFIRREIRKSYLEELL